MLVDPPADVINGFFLFRVIHGITHHGKTGLAIRLVHENRGLLADAEAPVQFVRVHREEPAHQHGFLELVVRHIDPGAVFQHMLHAVAGAPFIRCPGRDHVVAKPAQRHLLFFLSQVPEVRIVVLRDALEPVLVSIAPHVCDGADESLPVYPVQKSVTIHTSPPSGCHGRRCQN